MGTVNIIKVMKQVHPESILLVKVGTFYHTYGRDAYIISYLFGYQIKKVEANMDTCGFPKSAINKIIKKLEDEKISYITLNRSLNYEVEDQSNFKTENKYKDMYNKAHKYLAKKLKIDNIYQYLLENIQEENIKEKINKIEEILYEV